MNIKYTETPMTPTPPILPISSRPPRLTPFTRPHHALLKRARLLPPLDQALLRLRLEGNSLRDLAKLFALSRGGISRRFKRLINRLRDPTVAALADFPVDLPDDCRRVAIDHLVLGHGLRRIAANLALKPAQVAQMLAYVRGWAKLAPHCWHDSITAQSKKGAVQ